MDNRYQQLLRDILKPGIQAFLADQKLPDDFPVPQRSLEIFIKSFRSGLPPDLKNELPPHNLRNKQYLRTLLGDLDFFLGEVEASENDEKIGSAVPVLKDILEAQEKEREIKTGAVAGIQKWKSNLQQQVREHNRLAIQGLIFQQLKQQKEFQAVKNQTRLDHLSANVAATIQDYRLFENEPHNISLENEVKNIIRQAVLEEIKQISAEEKREWPEITANPQWADQIAIVAAKEVAPEILNIKDEAFSKEEEFARETPPPPPPAPSLKTMEIDVQAALRENMPPGTQPEAVNEILATATPEIMFRLGGAGKNPQAYLAQAVAAVFNLPKVKKIFNQQKISPTQTAITARGAAQYLAEDAQAFVVKGGIGGSPLGGGMAGYTPGGGPSIPGASPGGGASGGGPSASGAAGIFPEGTIDDIFYSSGQPLHLFTALASPHSGENLFNWLITGGPIKSAIGFIYDSTPGAPRLNYFNVGLGLMFQTRRQLEQTMMNLQPPERLVPLPAGLNYEHNRELQEVKNRLSFVNQQIDALRKIPGFDKFYNFYYYGWGRLLHPFQSLQMWAINRNIFAGLGVSGVVQTLSWTAQYGPAGFAYGIQQLPVQFGLLALKWGMSKTGLYKVVGLPGSRHYVFAPTYELGLWFKKQIYKKILQPIKINIGLGLRRLGRRFKIPGFVTAGRKIIGGLVGKLLAALMKFLGFLGLAWELIKALYNKIIKPGILFLFYLLLTHGLWAGAGALGGLLLGLPFAAKAFALTFGFFSPLITPFLAWIPASVAFVATEVVFLVFGAGAGALLHGLWDGFAANWTASMANFSLSKAALGLSGYALPVLGTGLGVITAGYLYTNMFLSSAFWVPTQLPQIQSSYFDVKKSASFSGKVGEPIKYTLVVNLKLEKKDAKLINLKINDTTNSSCQNQPPTIAERNFVDKIPAEIAFANPLTIDYEIPTDNSFNDCLITNTATVTADVENGPAGEQSFYTASVTIGNPPVSLPSIWPLANGCITQGPQGGTSHAAYHEEAIDIDSAASGKQALVTHNGTVIRAVNNQSTSTTGYGNYVVVSGSGPNGSFTTIYAHLQTVLVSVGQKLTVGQTVGLVGSSGKTGSPPGPHLHYEFTGLKLVPPYLPKDISGIRSCDGKINCNLCFP